MPIQLIPQTDPIPSISPAVTKDNPSSDAIAPSRVATILEEDTKAWAELERNIENGTLTADDWCGLTLNVGDPIFGEAANCIVRPATKNIILASEKSFKTTFGLRLMMGLSCGQTVFPQLPVPAPRSVLYVHGELSPSEIKERTLGARVGLHGSGFFQACNHAVNLCDYAGQRILHDLLDEHNANGHSPNVLVLDPWQSFIAGFDENSFKEMSGATKFIENLIHEYSLTVFIVVHTGKDKYKGARGHSLLAGWRDTLFQLHSTGELLTVTVKPRWAPLVPKFSLKFQNDTLQPTDSSSIRFTPQEQKIRQFLQDNGGQCSKSELGRVLGLESDSLTRALSRAKANEAISIDGSLVKLPEPCGRQNQNS